MKIIFIFHNKVQGRMGWEEDFHLSGGELSVVIVFALNSPAVITFLIGLKQCQK